MVQWQSWLFDSLTTFEKQQKANKNEYVDIATLTMSDLEDDGMGFQGLD